ncbi:MAG: hypothetical protein VB106_20510 [Clostridiaceae bacterium]|nr:hypothetical protein [Clostridiaceae bacterium]
MKKLPPYEQGTEFWSKMVNKLNDYMSREITEDPALHMKMLSSYNLTKEAYKSIRSAALYEVLCFAAYCSYVAGSKLFIRLIMGFDRGAWAEFSKGISDSLRTHIAALPDQETDSILPLPEAANMSVIRYMQTFTKGDAGANIPLVLTADRSTLKETFLEFEDNLEENVSMLMPDGEYHENLIQWCPDAQFIYNCAVECAGKK